MIRPPSYIPEPSDDVTVIPLYATPPADTAAVGDGEYKPAIMHFEDSDRSEFVETDEAHIYGEDVVVQAVYSMSTRELRGFAWNGKTPAPASPAPVSGEPVAQPGFVYFECPECEFSSVQKADFKGSSACPVCAGDSGHDVGMTKRVARSTDKPEGKDARHPMQDSPSVASPVSEPQPSGVVWPIGTDDQVQALAKECGWDNRRYMSPNDYAIWCEQMRKFARLSALKPVEVDEDMVERACAAYAKASGYYVEFHRGLRSESADRMRKWMAEALKAALGGR